MNKLLQFIVVFLLIIGWIFSGWPQMLSFAQEATSSPYQIATSTPPAETATSTPTDRTATSTSDEGPLEEVVSNSAPEPPQSQPSPLKERKLNKEVRIDKDASHQCTAKIFTVDLSGRNSAAIEISLAGGRGGSGENLEIGSLPLGIDITFLNNAGYEWWPQKSEGTTVLQIISQPGSQKGNFSIPIIYQSGNSTTICQINIINF